MMIMAVILGAVFTIAGLWLSYVLDIASGATIIIVSAFTLLASTLGQRVKRKFARQNGG